MTEDETEVGFEVGTVGPVHVAIHGCADCPLYEEARSVCQHPEGPEGRIADIFAAPPRACPLRRGPLTLLRIAGGL